MQVATSFNPPPIPIFLHLFPLSQSLSKIPTGREGAATGGQCWWGWEQSDEDPNEETMAFRILRKLHGGPGWAVSHAGTTATGADLPAPVPARPSLTTESFLRHAWLKPFFSTHCSSILSRAVADALVELLASHPPPPVPTLPLSSSTSTTLSAPKAESSGETAAVGAPPPTWRWGEKRGKYRRWPFTCGPNLFFTRMPRQRSYSYRTEFNPILQV